MSAGPERDDVTEPTVEGPVTGGLGKAVMGAGGLDLTPLGWVEEEFFISGSAAAATSATPLSPDGRWDVTPTTSAEYRTRILVRRPIDVAAADGTVVVEWLNVSGGLDADPDWTYLHDELIRSGVAWVGVSAQRDGIVPGDNPIGAILALTAADPERYGSLVHPGDDHSYDIFGQAGAAVRFAAAQVLGGLEPTQVLAIGESQSAFRLTTYVNAYSRLGIFDGYLLHSRHAVGAPLAQDAATPVPAPDPTHVRDDLDVPVMVLSAENDVAGERIGFLRARRPDTDRYVSWEIAGTAHVDVYGLGIGDHDDGSGEADAALFAAMQDPPSSVYFGVIECESAINAGPHTYVARAALSHLVRWARGGAAPPSMPPLEVTGDGGDLVRDDTGTALGGVRTPQVDVPVATLSGIGQHGQSFCALFGTTRPFGIDELVRRYGDRTIFLHRWNAALDDAVDAGVVLEADAVHLRRAVAGSSILA